MRRNQLALMAVILSAVCATPSYGIDINDVYVRRDSWLSTMRASLRKLAALERADGKGAKLKGSADDFVKVEEQQGVELSGWKVLPPFKAKGNKLLHDYGPESSIETQEWVDMPKWRAGRVINFQGAPGNSVVYSYLKLRVDSDRTVTANLGSDDGLAVYLGGSRVFANNASRGVGANQDKTKLALKKGVNHLLLKVLNGGGGMGVYFSLDSRARGSINTKIGGTSQENSRLSPLWARLQKDFGHDPTQSWEMAAEKADGIWAGDLGRDDIAALAKRYGVKTRSYEKLNEKARKMAAGVRDTASLARLRDVYHASLRIHDKMKPKDPAAPNKGLPPLPSVAENDGILNGPLKSGGLKARGEGNKESLKLAIEDLIKTYGGRYKGGRDYLARLENVREGSEEYKKLKKEALLANPLLDFEKVLMVRSKSGKRFAANWETRTSCGGKFDDELVAVNLRDGQATSVYKPGNGKFVGDICLYFDASKVLFSSHADKGALKNVPKTRGTRHYSVFEVPIDPRTGAKRGEPRMATPDMGHDVDNYYACYLPNDNIIFASTASYEGVPCVGGGAYVANLYLMAKNGSNVRRLTFDQDASWHPSLQANGRVMYVRWEYTDSAHYYSRLLMTMNPDGSDQKAYYG
ncbi:MAG: TolB-like translocation protein, partial [Planctomycetota bacterium]